MKCRWIVLSAIALGACGSERVRRTPPDDEALRLDAMVRTDSGTSGDDDADDDDDDDDAPPRDGGPRVDDATISGPSAPRILVLSGNVAKVTPSTPLIVSAVVTDPDGIDDLIGGALFDASGASYGSFATSAAEGSYSLTLTFDAIAALAPIAEVGGGATTSRTMIARFFDVGGAMAERSMTIELGCDELADGICDGECVSWSWMRCGGCDTWCGEDDPVFGFPLLCAGPGSRIEGDVLPAGAPYTCDSRSPALPGHSCGEFCPTCSAVRCSFGVCEPFSCDEPVAEGDDVTCICHHEPFAR